MIDLHRDPRPLRWYEWLAILLLAGYAAGARAGSVYQCVDAHGAATFQDRPCAAGADQSLVALAPAPSPAASPEYAVENKSTVRRTQGKTTVPRAAPAANSYECRTADGQVFYRHSVCPHSVPAAAKPGTKRGRETAPKSVAVTSTRISREDACYQLRRAGAAGRKGRDHDQDASSYDKNLGRDPCR